MTNFRIFLVLLAALLNSPAPGAAQERGESSSSSPLSRLFDGRPGDSIAKLEQSVVKIYMEGVGPKNEPFGGSGTGLIINREGYIATNWHVVHAFFPVKTRNGTSLQIYEPSFILVGNDRMSEPLQARVEFADADRDLAIIKVDEPIGQPALLAAELPERGMKVTALGYPGVADIPNRGEVNITIKAQMKAIFGGQATPTIGAFGRLQREPWNLPYAGRRDLNILQHSAAINGGNSGGPLFDSCGRAIGVNTASPRSRGDIIFVDEKPVVLTDAVSGIYFSSHVSELTDILDDKGISFTQHFGVCREAGSPDIMMYGLSFATLMSLGIAIFAMRRPVFRQAVVTGYSRLVSRPGTDNRGSGSSTPETYKPGSAHSPPLRGRAILSGLQPDGRVWRVEIERDGLGADGCVIGRLQEVCHHAFDDQQMSKRQARFFWADGRLMVEDLNSTNPTVVNGAEIEPFAPIPVKSGDTLLLGNVEVSISVQKS